MADRYWVGGSGNWNSTNTTNWSATSGGGGGASVPTTSDNVFFDQAGPYTVTIVGGGGARACLDLTVSGANITFTPNSGPSINVAGSVTLAASTIWSLGSPPGRMFLVSTTTGRTITTNGVNFGMPLTINSATGGWTLGSNLTINDSVGSGAFNLVAGTFSTSASNYSITTPNMTATGTLNLNGSTVTITTNTGFTGSGTINAGTSTIDFTSTLPTFSGGGLTYSTIRFSSTSLVQATVTGSNTMTNLIIVQPVSPAAYTRLLIAANQTITGTFTISSGGTDPTRRVVVQTTIPGTARTITSAANSLFAVDFQDITAAGVASWSDSSRTNYWGDCKGNTGITFATGRNVYWNLAGTQNWSATGWALTANGTPAVGNFPLTQDTANFTNSGSVGTVNFDRQFRIGTVDMSARTSAMTISIGNTTSIYGNWINGSGTTISGTNGVIFEGRTTQTITTAGKTFTNSTQISFATTSVQLNGDFTANQDLTLDSGGFDAVTYNVTIPAFVSLTSNTRSLSMGTGLWTLTGQDGWRFNNATNLTFNKGTANILLTGTTVGTFTGVGLTYNKLTLGNNSATSTLTIGGTNTFSELASTRTTAYTIRFSANQTITTWSVTGSSGNVVTINSNTSGTTRTLTIVNRTTGINWLDVEDITSTNLTPVTFYAGANTRLRSNVRGVAAVAPVANEYIYVLDTGTSWTVPANWNSANNEIHMFAGGGGGAGGRSSGSNRAGGGGGGGGGYTKVTNLSLTPGSSVSYTIGAAGTGGAAANNGTSGGNTTFNSAAYTCTGGGGGQATTTPTSVAGTAGTGSTFNGGSGGVGSTSTAASTGNGGGGGGGAGGPLGVGGNGGNGASATSTPNIGGGGGGGNGGGTNGGNAPGTSSNGGNGGNNAAGVGGGISNSATFPFSGGGAFGSPSVSSGFPGSCGLDISNAGMGSGGGAGGGGDANASAAVGGLFGAGGGGGGVGTGGTTRAAGPGSQGGIIIWYQEAAASNGNFFFLFG